MTRNLVSFHGARTNIVDAVTDMGMVLWGVIRADGGLPPWGSVKDRAMSPLCPEFFYVTKEVEGGSMRFFRPRPDVVWEHGTIEEARKRRWDIAAAQGGRNHGGNNVQGNAGDRRKHGNGKKDYALDGNAMGVTVPTS